MKNVVQATVRVWQVMHPLSRAGFLLILPCLLVRGFLEPAFDNAAAIPTRPTAAQIDNILGLFDTLTGVLILQVIGFLLAVIGVCLNGGKRKQVRPTPWWRDR